MITSRVACWLARPLTRVKDVTSGYFLVRRDALDGVTLDPIGFKIGLEVIAKAHYGKAIEVPYVFTDRVAGESKLNQGEIFNYLRQLAPALRGVARAASRKRRNASALCRCRSWLADRGARKRREAQRRRALEQVPEVRRGALPPRSRRESVRLHALRRITSG